MRLCLYFLVDATNVTLRATQKADRLVAALEQERRGT